MVVNGYLTTHPQPSLFASRKLLMHGMLKRVEWIDEVNATASSPTILSALGSFTASVGLTSSGNAIKYWNLCCRNTGQDSWSPFGKPGWSRRRCNCKYTSPELHRLFPWWTWVAITWKSLCSNQSTRCCGSHLSFRMSWTYLYSRCILRPWISSNSVANSASALRQNGTW